MDIQRAKEIIECLADGVNPMTGEVLPPDDSCNQAEVVRALHAILASLPEKKRKLQPENAGKPWSDEDDKTLVEMYNAGKSKREICNYFMRSPGGIAARLVRLGMIKDRDSFRS